MARLEGNTEISSSLIGLVVVVLVGTGLAMVVKQRFEYSTRSLEFQRESKAAQSELAEVRARHDDMTQRLLNSETRGADQLEEQKFHATERKRLASRHRELVSRRASLQASLDQLTREYAQQRAESRKKSRDSAVGEKMDTLVLQNGRTFSNVTIVRVTDEGLEIRHMDGTARVSSRDLAETMERRFQWAVVKP
jgi:hypothetical protein